MGIDGAENLAEVSAQAHGGRRNHRRQRFGIRHHHMAVAGFEPALEVPPRLIIDDEGWFSPRTSATFMRTFFVCRSVSSISRDSIRVSFSGCSLALVVVTKKATGPSFRIVTEVIRSPIFCG